jgi:hypothetical protein
MSEASAPYLKLAHEELFDSRHLQVSEMTALDP